MPARRLGRLHLSSCYFLKRSKIDISQNVKLLSGYFECSQRNPDERVEVKDPDRNNLVDYDAAIVNGLTSCNDSLFLSITHGLLLRCREI